MLTFKATLSQIRNNEIPLEGIREVFRELDIRTIEDFKREKNKKTINVPSFDNLQFLCKEKGQTFEEFFFGKMSKQDELTDEILNKKRKQWCKDNNVNSKARYYQLLHQGKLPEYFPRWATITKKYGVEWFADALGLSENEPTLENKLLESEFIELLKEWCIENNVDSISKYETKRKNIEWVPSAEIIRIRYGYDYFEQALGIKYEYNFLSKEEARQVCIEHHIFTSNCYPKFYPKYNENKDKRLPADPYQFYQTNWPDFIQLSPTQLFISNSMSSLELHTYKLLHDRNIDFEIEKTFDDCRSKNPLPFDFYLPNILSIPVIIELDGDFHRMEECNNIFYSKTLKERDMIKNNYCKRNNILLIRIGEITNIESVLDEKIKLNTIPKVKDLDWTSDFQIENEIIKSKLSKSLKVKLLLLMAERGKSKLSNIEIINLVKIKKPIFYNLKNELISLNLINRPNEYHYTEDDFEKMALLWKQGKNLAEISKETGYTNRNYLIKRLKEMGIDYKPQKKSKEKVEKLRNEIISLYGKGIKQVEISKKMNVSRGYVSLLIKRHRINIGELTPSTKNFETAKN
jgi:transposase